MEKRTTERSTVTTRSRNRCVTGHWDPCNRRPECVHEEFELLGGACGPYRAGGGTSGLRSVRVVSGTPVHDVHTCDGRLGGQPAHRPKKALERWPAGSPVQGSTSPPGMHISCTSRGTELMAAFGGKPSSILTADGPCVFIQGSCVFRVRIRRTAGVCLVYSSDDASSSSVLKDVAAMA
jgi:hypothetical protein